MRQETFVAVREIGNSSPPYLVIEWPIPVSQAQRQIQYRQDETILYDCGLTLNDLLPILQPIKREFLRFLCADLCYRCLPKAFSWPLLQYTCSSPVQTNQSILFHTMTFSQDIVIQKDKWPNQPRQLEKPRTDEIPYLVDLETSSRVFQHFPVQPLCQFHPIASFAFPQSFFSFDCHSVILAPISPLNSEKRAFTSEWTLR
jgi:hypothetical protein